MIILFWCLVSFMLFVALSLVLWPLVRFPKKHFITAFILFFFLLIGSGWFYKKTGHYDAQRDHWLFISKEHQVKNILSHIKNSRQLITLLKSHVDADPKNFEGWLLLGKLYMQTDQFVEAKTSFSKAMTLNKNSEDAMLNEVMADFFVHQKRLTADDVALLAHVLQRNPNQVNAINLLAIDAYLQHHDQIAINYWERLLPLFPDDSDDSHVILEMIAKAQKQITLNKVSK